VLPFVDMLKDLLISVFCLNGLFSAFSAGYSDFISLRDNKKKLQNLVVLGGL